jgi:hypothetical protein
MSLESLVKDVSRRCVEFETNLWEIADRHRWLYEDASDFVCSRREPTSKMLRDLAKEFHTKAESLKEMLEG